jgi:hypothetical protein
LDSVKVAAMVGLIRQAGQGGISDPDMLKAVSDAMLAVAAMPVPDGDRADGVCWMRGQAAQVLGLLESPGRDNAVAAVLLKMVEDPALILSQRCLAARALGQLNYSGATLAAGPYLEALAGLANDALASEKQATPNRRRLKGNLQYILNGLSGASAQHQGISELVKAGPEQQLLDTLRDKALGQLLRQLDEDPKLSDEALGRLIDTARSSLEGVVKKRAK